MVLPQLDSAVLQQLKANVITASSACKIPVNSLVPVKPGELLYVEQLSGMAFEVVQGTANARAPTGELCLAGFEKIVELCFELSSSWQGGRAIAVDDGIEFRVYSNQSPVLEISKPAAELEKPTTLIAVPGTPSMLSHVLTSPQPQPNIIELPIQPPPILNSTNSTIQSAIDCGTNLEPNYLMSSFDTEHNTIDSVISRYCNGDGKVYQGKGGPKNAFILWWSGIGITYQLRLLNGAEPPGQQVCKDVWNSMLTKCLTGEGKAQALVVFGDLEFKVYKYELVGTDREPFLQGKSAPGLEKPITPVDVPEIPSAPMQTPEPISSQSPPAQNSTNTTQYAMECGTDPNPWASWAKEGYMNERGAIDTVISRYCNGEGKVYMGTGVTDAFILWWSGIGITYQLRLLNGAPPPGQAMCKDVWNGILTKCFGEGKGQGMVLTDKYEFKVFDMDLAGTDKEPFLRPENVPTGRSVAGIRATMFSA
jgi:hypothetical protein